LKYDAAVTRSYHHGNLRAALIEAAIELARTGGPEAVVLREMARRVGVSHNAAYRHFADRDEVLAEVGGQAMTLLHQAMKDGMAAVRTEDPVLRSRLHLSATGRAYVEFALANPGLFAIAFAGLDKAGGLGDAEVHLAADPYLLLCEVLDEMVRTGAMPADRRPGADATCWAGVHGFSVLHLAGPLPPQPEVWRPELEHLLETVDRGLCAPAA
jgi:AcrR family transcriptional regulator